MILKYKKAGKGWFNAVHVLCLKFFKKLLVKDLIIPGAIFTEVSLE